MVGRRVRAGNSLHGRWTTVEQRYPFSVIEHVSNLVSSAYALPFLGATTQDAGQFAIQKKNSCYRTHNEPEVIHRDLDE